MARLLFPCLLFALFLGACASSKGTSESSALPEDQFEQEELAAHLRYLASDELLGRKTGTPGNDAAARYIAAQFREAGLDELEGAADYLQPVPFAYTQPPKEAHFGAFGRAYRQGEEALVLSGDAADLQAPFVFAGFGAGADDYTGLDAAGKIVVVHAGRPEDTGVRTAYQAAEGKRVLALEHGAVGLVELYRGAFPWDRLLGFLGGARFGLDQPAADALPHLWVKDIDGILADQFEDEEGEVVLVSSGLEKNTMASNNVVGVVRGRDPAKRDEYLVLTAHYDHVGVKPVATDQDEAAEADSIYNGARDNAMGVTAILAAADAFAAQPPDRSVLFIAFTAEEEGLLGSLYFAQHPLVPLDQMVYLLNIDNGGYSDTTSVVLIGYGRTSADSLIALGAARYGLTLAPDPAPEQRLFERSDNVHFAQAGIPAPTYGGGFKSFTDPGIANYYHRPEDEADDFDFAYLKRYVQAYVHASRLLANSPTRPFWLPGDPYEAAARALYGL